MKERPIPFSGPMVRAILEGRKTMTQRVLKDHNAANIFPMPKTPNEWFAWLTLDPLNTSLIKCPYGIPGDRLWVRETWKPGAWREDGRVAVDYKASPELTHTPWCNVDSDTWSYLWPKLTDEVARSGLVADDDDQFHWEPGKSPLKWRPAMFMYRWASRIDLEITGIRVERLQDITNNDALAEGTPDIRTIENGYDMRDCFRALWDQINGKTHPWDTNPWVWVIQFKKVQG